MNAAQKTNAIAKRAHEASYVLGVLPHEQRNASLTAIAKHLERDASRIQRANLKDIRNAQRAGTPKAMVGRLELDRAKIHRIAEAARQVALLPDPVGRLLEETRRPNGIRISKVSVPIGVLLIIFESRPNVTADCAVLGLKSGNSVILKGGREAFHTNQAIYVCIVKALKECKIPLGAVQLVPSTDRATAMALLKLKDQINLVIPRGGEALIRKVAELSLIPVIKHYKGVCHTYVDKDADLAMACRIAVNAKVQNPGVCNAMETLLVHKNVANKFLPEVETGMRLGGVELRGCPETRRILKGIKAARESDWSEEYLDLILSVRVVKSLDEAIKHIHRYGSSHSDAIVTQNKKTREDFLRRLDAACVFANVSTRFSDGGEFGMGAEIGISTDKLHARGPMGLRELTSYKYLVRGRGQIRG